jgi:hypothetical protein
MAAVTSGGVARMSGGIGGLHAPDIVCSDSMPSSVIEELLVAVARIVAALRVVATSAQRFGPQP